MTQWSRCFPCVHKVVGLKLNSDKSAFLEIPEYHRMCYRIMCPELCSQQVACCYVDRDQAHMEKLEVQ